MHKIRQNAISAAQTATTFGIILGTLGRQGSNSIFTRLRKLLKQHGKIAIPFLMAEINRSKLVVIKEIDIWVQVACPRLSIDWGATSTNNEDDSTSLCQRPILTPYELEVALGVTPWQTVYPMDYYSNDGGLWANMSHRK